MLPVNFYGRVVDTPQGKKWIDTQVTGTNAFIQLIIISYLCNVVNITYFFI